MTNVLTLAGAAYARMTDIADPLILDYARGATFMPNLVRRADLTGKNSKTHKFASFGTLAAAAKVEGTDLAPASFTLAADGSITVADVAVAVEIPYLTQETGSNISLDDISRQLGNAVGAKIETDLVGLFPSFSTNSVGTTTVAATVSIFEDMIYALRANAAPIGGQSNMNLPGALAGIHFVGHEKTVSQLEKAFRAANYFWAPPDQNALMNAYGSAAAGGVRAVVLGVPVWASLYNATANAAADYVSGMFASAALGLVTIGGPKLITQEWAVGTATRLVGRATYGAGIIKDIWGCKLTSAV